MTQVVEKEVQKVITVEVEKPVELETIITVEVEKTGRSRRDRYCRG